MKVVVDGRLPPNMDKDLRFALIGILRDLASNLNEINDTVMAKANHSAAITADASVKASPCTYRGFTVLAATATAAIDIRDSTSAGAGVVIDTIPSGTAAGTRVEKAVGINCETGLYVDYGASATGTVSILFE
jgi:hypothetical protein